VRSELSVPAGAKIPLVQIKLDINYQKIISRNRVLIERLARLSSISEECRQLDGVVAITVEGGEFALQIAKFI
mgnify:CR=1